jgi:predicted DNA-binding transcriptional regulator AlpA
VTTSGRALGLSVVTDTDLSRVEEGVRIIEEEAARLPVGVLPWIAGRLEEAKTRLLPRLLAVQAKDQPRPNRLLAVEEAAPRLGMSQSYLYKHADEFPFTVRQGARLKFSEAGLEDYIRRKSGR